jgi:hypothetical protein
MVTFDERYLLDAVGRVLDFAQQTVGRFAVLASHWPKEYGEGQSQLDKILGETSVLLLTAARASSDCSALRPPVAALAHVLSPLVRSERCRVLLMRSRRSAGTLLMPNLMLGLSGYPDPAFDQLLNGKRPDDWPGGERIAFRHAESRWLHALVQGTQPVLDDLLPFSLFASEIDPFEMDRMDLYAITHWLMYASDFGVVAVPPSISLPSMAVIDGAIASQLSAEDLDLLAELLMGVCMLRIPWSVHAAAAWAVLAATWDQLGFVPSPNFQKKNFQQLKGDEQEAYAVANTYHTQYVFGMLAALLLRRAPPDVAAEVELAGLPELSMVVDACLAAAARAHAFVGRSCSLATPTYAASTSGSCWMVLSALAGREKNEAPFWIKALSRMPESERARVGVDALLVQAVRRYDLDLVAKLVELVSVRSMMPSRVYRQALLWLTRQQTPEGAIGAHFVNQQNLAQPEAKVVSGLLGDLLYRAADHLTHTTSD